MTQNSITSIVRDRVRRIAPNTDITIKTLLARMKNGARPGRHAVVRSPTLSVLLSRMVSDGELFRVRQGVYRRGKP